MKKQASAQQCFVCGVHNPFGLHLAFYEGEPGETTAEVTIPEQYQGYPGVVHGGIVAAMLDEVSARAMLGDGAPRFMVTVKMSVRYRRPVPVGKRLIIKGHAGQVKGSVAYVTGEITAEDGSILAEVESVLADIPPELRQTEQMDGDAWKVYPD